MSSSPYFSSPSTTTDSSYRSLNPLSSLIVDRNSQIIGFEALARRWEPRQQRYQGIDFLSLSDEESLHLDIVMLRAILRDLPRLAQSSTSLLSINLNPALNSPTYQNLLLLVLIQARKVGLDIWFEVLEHSPLQHKELALPYEIIKLDRSLLLQATKSSHALQMLTGLVEYLQRLGTKVVCEGVETQQHIEVANRLGCDYQQGYAHAISPLPLGLNRPVYHVDSRPSQIA